MLWSIYLCFTAFRYVGSLGFKYLSGLLHDPKNKIKNYMKTFYYKEIFFILIQISKVLGKNNTHQKKKIDAI